MRSQKKCRSLAALALFGLAVLAHATVSGADTGRFPPSRPKSHSPPANPALAPALALIEEAQRGSAEAALRAVEELRHIVSLQPGNALARANLGLAVVLCARDVSLADKRRFAIDGLAEIDAAVSLAPGDPEVRLVRAINASQMPLLLGRRKVARSDFAWLLGVIDARPALAPDLKRRVLFHAGAWALRERQREAVPLLERALAIAAPSPSTHDVQSMLALARRQLNPASHAEIDEGHKIQASAP
ncbi:MAG TPA: hypothetical protein VGA56_00660 [Opitutaceae bacterium]